MGSNPRGTIINRNTEANNRDVELVKRGHESTAGFARLAEQQEGLPGTVNEVSTGGRGARAWEEGILKRESFELSFNHAVEHV